MFREESEWLRAQLDRLELPAGGRVLDIGSQSLIFRTGWQSWIDENLHQPLLARGHAITFLDLQDDEGVDVVADITAPDFDAAAVGTFDLVFCCNLLEHVTDRPQTMRALGAMLAPDGHLVVTVPHRFPYHEDPIDTMYRPGPQELARDLDDVLGRTELLASTSVVVTEKLWYKTRAEALRRLVPPLRWRTSCVVLRRSGAALPVA